MAKLFVKAQTTSSRSEYVFVQDSASSTGGGKTGITFNASGLTAYFVRPVGSATVITLVTQTVTGVYSSGGFVEVDATHLPGIYRFDIPNAVFASGVDHAMVMLKGASGMAPVFMEYQLTGFDPSDIADSILGADIGSSTNAGTLNERTVRSALRAMRNKVAVSAGTMTVFKEDDTSTAWTTTVSNTADITVDPA